MVKGSVKDNTGKPISGVVVTDGAHFNTTDAEGNYVLNTDPARYPMVYISTPAAYELPSKEGIADGFYQYLDAGKSENQCDFVLTKRQKPLDESIPFSGNVTPQIMFRFKHRFGSRDFSIHVEYKRCFRLFAYGSSFFFIA